MALFAVIAATACGDDRLACGEGTEDNGMGLCVPAANVPPTCTAGTRLDPQSNTCEPDPAACQNGTVLIDGACVDPAEGLSPDVEEGVEPNGFGQGGEPSTTPAGSFTLKPVGGPGAILHGHLTARPDRDDDGQLEPDYDTFLVDVAAPTLLRITADGVNGTAGGFVVISDAARLERWIRTGVATTGDVAKRTVYLPTAGRYRLAIADTRSILADAAVGTATSEYYVTIEQLPLPVPMPLVKPAGSDLIRVLDTLAPDETRLFMPAMDIGLSEFSLATESGTGALVVTNEGVVRDAAGEAEPLLAGRLEEPPTIVVVEPEINTATAPIAFDLRITVGHATGLAGNQAISQSTSPRVLSDLAQFSFDATAAGQLVRIDLDWAVPVDGVLVDERGRVVSPFSWDPQRGAAFGLFAGFGEATWSGYHGVLRVAEAGRYYFLVYDPALAPSGITPVGTLATLTPTALAFGTPLAALAPGTVLDYPGNAEAWQRFTLTAGAGSNGAHASFYDASSTTGRLGDLVLHDLGGGPDLVDPGDGIPVVDVLAAPNNTGAAGHVMLGAPQHLLVVVQTDRPFDIAVTAQSYTDEGTRLAGSSIMHAAQALGGGTTRRLYLVRTTPGTIVTAIATPTAGLDIEVASLDADETVLASSGGSLEVIADARGWVAIQVDGVGTGTFDIELRFTAPYYTAHVASAAWANACIGGTDVTPADRDDGFTQTLPVPAGFEYFGTAPTSMTISTNGWLTFDTTTPITGAQSRAEQRLPSPAAPNAVIAAYWDDLDDIRICTKMIGTRLVVQWRGALFLDPEVRVATQAILDTTDDSITLVRAPYHEATGTSASAGVENGAGVQGTSVFFRLRVDPGSATKLTHP